MKFELTQGNLGPTLQKYIEDRSFCSIITGPLGSGKSYSSVLKVFNIMCQQKPDAQGNRKTRTYVIRNTFGDLLTTIFKDFEDLFGDLAKVTRGGSSPPEMRFNFRLQDRTKVKSEVIFVALDRPQAIKKLRGSQLTLGYLSEVKELDKSILDMLSLRIGRYPSKLDGGPTFYGILGDTNQVDEDHYLYAMAEEEKPEGYSFFTQPGGLIRETRLNKHGFPEWTGKWLNNPEAENLNNLPDNYYGKGKAGKANSWIAVNLANEYGIVMEGMPIYKEQWSDHLHSTSSIQLIPDRPITIGMDFGLDPSAVIAQETPHGTLNVLEELTGQGMGIEQFVKSALKPLLNEKYHTCPWNFVGDPAGNRRADTDENTVFKVLESHGLTTDAANTNDPEVRWEAVRGFLTTMLSGSPAFQLHKRCKILRKGFSSGYHFRRVQVTGDKRYTDKANKNKYSHLHDALQYLCMWFNGDTVPTIGFSRPDDSHNGFVR